MISIVLKTFLQIKKRKKRHTYLNPIKKEISDGEQKRDFVYIKDCISALLWFLENKKYQEFLILVQEQQILLMIW